MKKTLNLDFVELERLEGNTDVCLMPCPCSGSEPSYSVTYEGITYQSTGGLSPPCVLQALAWIATTEFVKAAIDKGQMCQAEQAATDMAAECGYDIDFGGTTNSGPSCGCGGGPK